MKIITIKQKCSMECGNDALYIIVNNDGKEIIKLCKDAMETLHRLLHENKG